MLGIFKPQYLIFLCGLQARKSFFWNIWCFYSIHLKRFWNIPSSSREMIFFRKKNLWNRPDFGISNFFWGISGRFLRFFYSKKWNFSWTTWNISKWFEMYRVKTSNISKKIYFLACRPHIDIKYWGLKMPNIFEFF